MAPPRKAQPKQPQPETLQTDNEQANVGQPNAPYIVQPQYGGSDNAAPTTFLMPPDATPPQPGQPGSEVVIDLLRVDGPNAQPGSKPCAIPAGTGDNQDFWLEWVMANFGGTLARVHVKPDNLWKTDPSARLALRKSFDAFKQQLEDLELNAGCLTRGGASYVWQTVGASLPLPISETLYYRYGFDPASRFVDLLPGMRLRVEWGDYQFVSPSQPGAALNGMAGQGSSIYEICRVTDSQGNRRVAFDAFLGTLNPPAVAGSQAGSGSLIDLQGAGSARRYYRLFYPASMPSSDAQGAAGIVQNVTLIGADTLADLYAATRSYVNSGTCARAAAGNLPILCNFFRGRVIAIPEISVALQGQRVYVPLGTTVRNLVDRLVNANLPVFNPPINFFSILSYTRLCGPMPGYGTDLPNQNFRYSRPVQFTTLTGNTLPAGPDVYDLPAAQADGLMMSSRIF